MEEMVDMLIDFIEKKLEQIGIDLDIQDLDQIRDTLDFVLDGYDKE